MRDSWHSTHSRILAPSSVGSVIDHDRLFKELLTTFFWEFLELFIPPMAASLEPSSIVFLDKEVFTDVTVGDKYEADLIVKGKVRGENAFFLLHVEHQAQPQPAFDKRMFRYFARLYEKHDLPIYPIALFSYQAPKTPQPNCHQVTFPSKVVLSFHYDLIQLNQLHWRDFLQQRNPVAAALMSKMNIAPSDRLQVKAECLRLMATLKLDYARMRLISGFVDTYLKLTAEENRLLQAEIGRMEPEQQEVVMQIVTSWMEDGLQQGLQEGELSVILRQLNRKVGELTPELRDRIRQLSLAQLDALAESLLDFSHTQDLVDWLAQSDR